MTTVEIAKKLSGKRILVVDDGPQLVKAFRMVLGIAGDYRVEIAEDGESALAKFDTGEYDLVITDLQLPKMGGLDLAKAIKQRRPAQPVVLITAYAESLRDDPKLLAQVDFLLEKPFSLQQLQGVLAQVFPAT